MRFKNSLAAPTLYNLGIRTHGHGVIKNEAKAAMFDFYMADYVAPEQKAALLAIAPDAQFKSIGPSFAPEIKKVAICFPKAAFYRQQA